MQRQGWHEQRMLSPQSTQSEMGACVIRGGLKVIVFQDALLSHSLSISPSIFPPLFLSAPRPTLHRCEQTEPFQQPLLSPNVNHIQENDCRQHTLNNHRSVSFRLTTGRTQEMCFLRSYQIIKSFEFQIKSSRGTCGTANSEAACATDGPLVWHQAANQRTPSSVAQHVQMHQSWTQGHQGGDNDCQEAQLRGGSADTAQHGHCTVALRITDLWWRTT